MVCTLQFLNTLSASRHTLNQSWVHKAVTISHKPYITFHAPLQGVQDDIMLHFRGGLFQIYAANVLICWDTMGASCALFVLDSNVKELTSSFANDKTNT